LALKTGAAACRAGFFCLSGKNSKKVQKTSCYFQKNQYNGSEGEPCKGRQM